MDDTQHNPLERQEKKDGLQGKQRRSLDYFEGYQQGDNDGYSRAWRDIWDKLNELRIDQQLKELRELK